MTSSHSQRPPKAEAAGDRYSWCVFKRPQVRQCRGYLVKVTARTPPPAFLFPIQRCQRPDRVSPTPLFSAGGRRRRPSSGRPHRCQSVLSDIRVAPRIAPEFGAKTAPGRRGATLIQSVAIRLRLGKISILGRKARGVFAPFQTASNWPRPSGRRLSTGRPPGCQSPSSNGSFFPFPEPVLAPGGAHRMKEAAPRQKGVLEGRCSHRRPDMR